MGRTNTPAHTFFAVALVLKLDESVAQRVARLEVADDLCAIVRGRSRPLVSSPDQLGCGGAPACAFRGSLEKKKGGEGGLRARRRRNAPPHLTTAPKREKISSRSSSRVTGFSRHTNRTFSGGLTSAKGRSPTWTSAGQEEGGRGRRSVWRRLCRQHSLQQTALAHGRWAAPSRA